MAGIYDVVIVGAGAAGLTAGIYVSRKKLKNLIISVDVGGLTNLTNHIENYPGAGTQPGPDLMNKFFEEAKRFGSEFKYAKVEKVNKQIDGAFELLLEGGESIKSKTVILAFGSLPKMIGVPGETKFLGRGVSTCATCDAPLYKGKVTAVIGGGNSAVEGALELSNIASKTYLIHRREEFRADPITLEKLKSSPNVEILTNANVLEIIGDKKVETLKLKTSFGDHLIKVDGVFIEIGHEVKADFIKGLVDLNPQNEVIVDLVGKTNVPGIFAAGDATINPYKQTVISAGSGATAALECYKYIMGSKAILSDWK